MIDTTSTAIANTFIVLYREHGHKVLGEVTLDQAYGGARGVKCLVWEVRREQAVPALQKRQPINMKTRDLSWTPKKVFASEERL